MAFIALVHTLPPHRSARAIHLAGTGTTWTGSTTFTASGAGSLVRKIVNSGTTTTLVVATGAPGTLTIGDGTTTTTIVVKAVPRRRWWS